MHGAERFKPEKPLLAQNQHGTANPDQSFVISRKNIILHIWLDSEDGYENTL